MADINQIQIDNITYDIEDPTARAAGLPAGGSANDLLKKSSNADYDTEWLTPTGILDRPDYTVSTTDLTAGTSQLATGALYFVYEA